VQQLSPTLSAGCKWVSNFLKQWTSYQAPVSEELELLAGFDGIPDGFIIVLVRPGAIIAKNGQRIQVVVIELCITFAMTSRFT
jgi:hypothetical protein